MIDQLDEPDDILSLLERAVLNARSQKGLHPRWVAVMTVFELNTLDAHNLCAFFGIDPDELVSF